MTEMYVHCAFAAFPNAAKSEFCCCSYMGSEIIHFLYYIEVRNSDLMVDA